MRRRAPSRDAVPGSCLSISVTLSFTTSIAHSNTTYKLPQERFPRFPDPAIHPLQPSAYGILPAEARWTAVPAATRHPQRCRVIQCTIKLMLDIWFISGYVCFPDAPQHANTPPRAEKLAGSIESQIDLMID